MKKFLALILSLAMILSLAACGNKPGSGGTPPASSGGSSAPAGGAGAADPQPAPLAFPEKDITIIVPFDAGGANDVYGRVVAKVAMENGYFNGRNIIVENMPGGGASIGQAYVANTAAADGYTLITMTASGVTNPILKDVPFTMADFKTVICANADPTVMIARPDAPFDDVAGLLEYAKDHTLIAVDSGFGTSSHIRTLDWTSKLSALAGIEIKYEAVHVDSGNLQLTNIMGSHADISCNTASECADAIIEGTVKAIGIMDPNRYFALPDVASFSEQGYEGFVDGADRAISCSAKVPDDVYNYLVEEFTRLCSSEEFKEAMSAANLTPACKSAAEYQEFIDKKTELVTSFKDFLLAGE